MAAERMRPMRREQGLEVDDDVIVPTALAPRRVRHVRWGPIVGVFLAGLTGVVLLSTLGIGLSITIANPWTTVPWGSLVWGGLASAISYFIGGFVAGRSSGTFDRSWGALSGALVFTLSIPFTMWLASMGAAAILGGLGNILGGIYADWLAPA